MVCFLVKSINYSYLGVIGIKTFPLSQGFRKYCSILKQLKDVTLKKPEYFPKCVDHDNTPSYKTSSKTSVLWNPL
jgi:hypothetical protein